MDNLLKFIFVAVILMSNDSHITPEHIEEVSWKKTDEDEDILVLLYQNHESLPDSSDERYRDRVEFFTAEIPKGNFSLRLKSVRTEDKGVYMCQVFAGGLTANATVVLERLGFSVSHIMVLILCISAFGSALLLCCLIYCRSHNEGSNVHGPSGPLVALQGCSVILPCYVNEKTEGLNVEWRKTDSGNQVYKYSYKDGKSEKSKDAQCDSHFFTDRIQHGNFSLHLDNLRPEDAGEYTCSVSAKINVKLSLLGPSSLPDSLRLHLFLVFCPNMIMFFAFVFWGVSEGSLNESVSCCALYFLRPLVLLWAAPYIKDLTDTIKRPILEYGYFAEYVPFSIVVYSALFRSTWQKVLNYPEFDRFVIIVLFSVVILSCLCKIIYVSVKEILKPSGLVINIFDLVADMTFDIVPTLQFILLFYTFASIRGAFIVIVILPVLMMMTNDRWTFRCGSLDCPLVGKRAVMLFFSFVINAVMISLYIITMEKKTEPIGWSCVMVFMQLLWAVMKFTDKDFIYLHFNQAFHRVVPVYLFGSVGFVLLTSVALLAEMILTANGDHAVGDLRLIVFPLESFFVFCVLISAHIPSVVSGITCLQCCQREARANDFPVTGFNQNQDSQNAAESSESPASGSNQSQKTAESFEMNPTPTVEMKLREKNLCYKK
ncbi:uncharacterized protein LOC131537980 isoform X4 [Onychostoma macrolepis]|uniref:uncharacterized protein LOC131537980 isoform X4 n=1 Tax=Onychostoma macrolepis TaxID=369639 RepID=UPI0027296A98|nr:uncharacterized protein LOC131537980 isoform X4 [Onychostoma macrolepis]